MAITTVGGLKTSTAGSGTAVSVTLDTSPTVNEGDLIVWMSGATDSSAPVPSSGTWTTVTTSSGTASSTTYTTKILVMIAAGGEEGDTITGDATTYTSSFCSVRVFRPSAGWVLDPAIDRSFVRTAGGTSSSYTLTAGTATTEGDTLGLCAMKGNTTAATTNWDAAGAGTPDYRADGQMSDYKIYTATATPTVTAATLPPVNKRFAGCWIQERPRNAGQFLPFFGA